MRLRAPLIAVLVMVGSAAVMFHFFQRQLLGASFAFGAHPEILSQLEASLDDQKLLADLDPESRAGYRQRFAALEKTVQRLRILEHSRGDLVGRYETILLVIFSACVLLVTGVYALRQSRHEPRLARLRHALADLAGGQTDLEIGDRGRDTIGRIASMIERTSRVMARDRRRLAALKNLAAWQEAARRQAHEMRTPLTGARLELTRVRELIDSEPLKRSEEMRNATDSALQEIDRLGRFTREFTSFARLPQPQLTHHDLGRLLAEFSATYAQAWQGMRLEAAAGEGIAAPLDRDMLRQVLVNLCDNSALALDGRPGSVTFSLTAAGDMVHLDVEDDGPGIAEEIQERLFQPYATTRTIGKGMGLGLAISKKILLDHDGDLELLRTSPGGTVFRLSLPATPPDEPSVDSDKAGPGR